jgi:hypothetical protein
VDGGDVITVVAVVVAGIVSPWIAGQIASRAQSKRFEHERTLHDLDDLRRELDALGDVLGEFIRAVAALASATDDDAQHERYCEAADKRSLITERVARLRFRLHEEEDVVTLAREALDGLSDVVSEHAELTDAEIEERIAASGSVITEFFRAAYRLVGARVS